MASLINREGLREVQFILNRKRRAVRLGPVSQTAAETAKRHIEQLIQQHMTGHPADRYVRQWLADINDTLYDRIAAAGLVPPRVSSELGPFIDRFIKDRGPEFKAATILAWKMAKKTVVEHFTSTRDIRTITEGDAQAFRAWMLQRGLAEATVRRRCAHAKNMFGYGVRLRLIDNNPFGNKAVPTASPKGKAKTFIDDALSRRILEHLPDARWRLIWALARWGGVRIPSEIAALRWDGVDQAAGRLTIYSPKTERYHGQDVRQIPLFPEIEQAMMDWYEVSYNGDAMVFPGASISAAAYRDTLIRAINRAGGKLWPKLWTAVRATRRTELKQPMANGLRLPDEAVNAWMGHSSTIGTAHYGTGDQLVESAFAAVLGNDDAGGDKRSKKRSTKPVQTRPDAQEKPRFQPSEPETGVESWPTGTRTPTNRIRICCAANYTMGQRCRLRNPRSINAYRQRG